MGQVTAWAVLLLLFAGVLLLLLFGGAWLDRLDQRADRRYLTNLRCQIERDERRALR